MGDFFAELIQRHVTRVALGVLFAAALWPAPAKEATNARSAVPDFSSNDVSWEGVGSEFMPPASGPGPVMSDKAHPYVPNNTGKQPTFRVADLNNPILKPWVIEELRKANQRVLAGAAMFTRDARCWTPGVPAFLLDPGQLYFIQTPKEVLLIAHDDHRVRRIYLDVPHSKNLKPSWDGESIGHYEGDTLVVDTIGLNDKTLIDYYRTPHTTALHVVERFRLIEEGKTL